MRSNLSYFSRIFTCAAELSKAEIFSAISGTYLGVLWWLIEPLLLMLVFYFVIEIIFLKGGEGYHIFVICSLVTWQLFSRSINSATKSILSSRNLILRAKVPLEAIVSVPILSNLFYSLFGFLVVLGLNQFQIHNAGLFVLCLLVLNIMMLAIAEVLAVITVYLSDVKKFIAIGLRGMWFLSPVLYDLGRVMNAERLPDWFIDIYMLNPMVSILESVRYSILGIGDFYAQNLIYIAMLSAIVVVVMHFVLKHRYGVIAKRL